MTLLTLLQTSLWTLTACVFLLSLLIGSFLNVVIHRLPIMLDRQWRRHAEEALGEPGSPAEAAPAPLEPFNLLVPRSRCPKCHAEIRAHQNIPLISYALLGGACASCRAPISPRYPAVELGTALLSAAVAWHFGWQWLTLGALGLTWALVALSAIDLDHQLLPDAITLPLLWGGLLFSLVPHGEQWSGLPPDPQSAIIGAAAGYLSLWAVFWAFKLLTGKEGMGYGDFKLFGALGAWMGWQMLPLIILLAAFTGAAIGIALIVVRGRDRNVPIPFGPYLAAAGWIALMWGPGLLGGYLRLTGLEQ
ncbi:MAG TPA: A24 family peptidase [Steroidobacteraceae bacterium]|nr:A24 family peptidase [Steroidobacteraceae bacterium]